MSLIIKTKDVPCLCFLLSETFDVFFCFARTPQTFNSLSTTYLFIYLSIYHFAFAILAFSYFLILLSFSFSFSQDLSMNVATFELCHFVSSSSSWKTWPRITLEVPSKPLMAFGHLPCWKFKRFYRLLT